MVENDNVVQTGNADGVGIIELSRPEKFNCLSGEVARAIDEALSGYLADEGVRVIFVRLQGKHFCTAADPESRARTIKQMASDLTQGPPPPGS